MSIYDEETVREWAYDPDRRMIDDADQDEDLTIGLLPLSTLLPLIDDPSCPKGGYILQCLDYHHANLIRRGQDYDVAETRIAAIEAAKCNSDALQEWAKRLERLLAFRVGVGPVDLQTALVIGREVLLDMSRQFFDDVELKEEDQTSFVIELADATSTFWERLQIDKATGRFSFSRSGLWCRRILLVATASSLTLPSPLSGRGFSKSTRQAASLNQRAFTPSFPLPERGEG